MSEELAPDPTLEEIYTWIEQIQFSKPKKNLARDFSDGGNNEKFIHFMSVAYFLIGLMFKKRFFQQILVFMAELLKRYYPKHIDIHNYVPGNSVAKKIDNWCTLNRKVLSKLDIKIGKDIINKLANSQPGIIEKVLIELRTKILKDCNAERNTLYSEYQENEKTEVVKSVLNTEEVANKTVPRHVFVRLKQELEEKNEMIKMLHQKVSHLESLIKLKDQRITDLTSQIIKPVEQNTPRSVNLSSTSNVVSKLRTKII